MINYYQPWYISFFTPKRHAPPKGVVRYYYHSFEDGLWDLVTHRFPNGALFLIPDFYCMDVLENIVSHGSRYVFYPLDADFQIAEQTFETLMKQCQPDIAVVFHACGITSHLMEKTGWMRELKPNALVLEDCVHRLVNQSKIGIVSPNHVVMDSMRKVSPVPGSFMYGSARTLSFKQARTPRWSWYFLSSFLLYIAFRATLEFGFLVNSERIVTFAHRTLLKMHDDIIGDSKTPHQGTRLFQMLAEHMDIEKIQKIKERQAKLYERMLEPLFQHGFAHHIAIPSGDYQQLHVYPLVFEKMPDAGLEAYLRSRNMAVWFKFPDAPWSSDKSVLFLPLGPQIKDWEIKKLAQTLREWFGQNQIGQQTVSSGTRSAEPQA